MPDAPRDTEEEEGVDDATESPLVEEQYEITMADWQ